MQLSFLTFLKNQWGAPLPIPTTDVTGKTIVVFGANTGIGFETAKHFCKLHPSKVIIACRNKEKGEVAVSRLKGETNYSSVYLRILDLAKFSSVIEFADKFEQEEERLDILIANAGVALYDYRVSTDGWEETLQVNNLSTLLAIILLLPVMCRTAEKWNSEPRITVVSSATHYGEKIEEKLLQETNPLRVMSSKEYCTKERMKAHQYGVTKLIVIFIVRKIAFHVRSTPIIANAVDPGFCYSEIRRELALGWVDYAVFKLLDVLVARPTEVGGRQLVWAALAENKSDEMKGAYVDTGKVVEPSDFSVSEEGLVAQEKFWDNMVEELSKVDARVSQILQELGA